MLDLFRKGHTKKALDNQIVQFLTEGVDENGNAKAKAKDLTTKLNTFIHITLTRMFDGAFASPKDADKDTVLADDALLVGISSAIGRDIEMFYRMSVLRDQDKSLFNQVYYGNLSDQVLGQDWHVKAAKGQLNEVDSKWDGWTHEQHVRIGRILVGIVTDHYANSEEECPFDYQSKWIDGESLVYMVPTESLAQQVDMDFGAISEKLMTNEFMVCPCVDWSDGVQGGYLTNNEVQRDDIIRGHNFLGRSKPSQMVYDFINTLQGVAYKVNTDVLEVANALEASKVKVGKFYPQSSITSQLKKDGTPFKDSIFTQRATVRTKYALKMAREYAEFDRLWTPWSFDFRGRVYPMVSYCSPQGTDLDKALITLADGEELTEVGRWWLYIHIATTFGQGGVDKLPLADRVEWTHNNHDLLVAVATDPVGNLDKWSGVSEPWMFLAGCLEYVKVVINGGLTTLMVATDATCSGLQVLSGLGLDRETGFKVNVVPSDSVQDAYAAVARKAVELLTADGEVEVTKYLQDPSNARKVAKKVVMTVPYNATNRTNYDQVGEAFKDLKVEVSKDDVNTIGKAIVAGMGLEVPGAIELRNWFNGEVLDYFKRSGAEFLEWTTPSGFVVHQENFAAETITIKTTMIGGKRSEMEVTIGPKRDDDGALLVRANGHKTSFMPNLIHSLDASLLAKSFHSVDYSVSVIHDSILTGANHMGQAVQALKESYRDMFQGREYLDYLKNEVLCTTVEAPVFDESFDSAEVLDSEFFFS